MRKRFFGNFGNIFFSLIKKEEFATLYNSSISKLFKGFGFWSHLLRQVSLWCKYCKLQVHITYLVSWEEENVGIIIESIICPIPMVNIEINDKDMLKPMYTLCVTSCYCHITKDTKAHRSLWDRMVTRRSDQSKTSRWILGDFRCIHLK